MRECRAGIRRWGDTSLGEKYQHALAHYGEGDASAPDPWARTLGDLIDPGRAGSMATIINTVSRDMGTDAADWPLDRLLLMVAQLTREREALAPDV